MLTIKDRRGRRGATLVAIVAVVGLIGAACTPPPPPSDDTIIQASQQPGGLANYVNRPVPSVLNESYLVITPDVVAVRSPNAAVLLNGHDKWSLRCAAPITWIGTGSYSCPAGGYFRQESGTALSLFGGPGLIHEYTTLGALVVVPGAEANRATFTGLTESNRSLQSNLFGGYDEFVDGARVGQTWNEVLEVEDGDGGAVLVPDQDSVLFDRPDPIANGVVHELFNLPPLSVPLPTPVPPQLIPPIEETFRGEVEVESTMVSAAAVLPLPPTPLFSVDEMACDGPQTTNPDGSSSCPASGRRATQGGFGGSGPGLTDHYDAVGTLTTSAGGVPATAIFEGTLSYVRTQLADGTDWVNPDLAGSVEPRYLQFQDGRPTDVPYSFPD